jgi:putative Se/S carrier protein
VVKDGDYVAIFNSVHRVMEAERLLKDKKLKIMVIPAPRELAADCGLALRYPEELKAEVEGTLVQAGLMPPNLYRKSGETFQKIEEEK